MADDREILRRSQQNGQRRQSRANRELFPFLEYLEARRGKPLTGWERERIINAIVRPIGGHA